MVNFRGSEYVQWFIKKGVAQGRKFLVYGDPDIDGMVACYFVCKFLGDRGINYTYYINENRKHGFKLPLDKISGLTIIGVDFAMTPKEIEDVTNSGADIILIDHHNITSTELVLCDNIEHGTFGCIINNQYSFEPKEHRYLSGAGVVYNVLGLADSNFLTEENKALVGITLLTDIRELENEYAQDFLRTTYTSKAPMIQRLIDVTKPDIDYGFGVICMDRNYIEYTFSPKFNSMFRANKGYEAFEFMLGKPLSKEFINMCREFQNKVIQYIMDNLKGVEYSNIICKHIENKTMQGLSKEIDVPSIFLSAKLSNYIGLVASRIRGTKDSLLYITNSDGVIERGSFRGKSDRIDYLRLFVELGAVADGHKNAFGFFKFVDCDEEFLNYCISECELNIPDPPNEDIEVANLSIFNMSSVRKVAEYNIYVRSQKRKYIKYIGNNATCTQVGKLFKWDIDGVSVKAFSDDITPENGYILPMIERNYIVYYLKNRE